MILRPWATVTRRIVPLPESGGVDAAPHDPPPTSVDRIIGCEYAVDVTGRPRHLASTTWRLSLIEMAAITFDVGEFKRRVERRWRGATVTLVETFRRTFIEDEDRVTPAGMDPVAACEAWSTHRLNDQLVLHVERLPSGKFHPWQHLVVEWCRLCSTQGDMRCAPIDLSLAVEWTADALYEDTSDDP